MLTKLGLGMLGTSEAACWLMILDRPKSWAAIIFEAADWRPRSVRVAGNAGPVMLTKLGLGMLGASEAACWLMILDRPKSWAAIIFEAADWRPRSVRMAECRHDLQPGDAVHDTGCGFG